MLQQKLWQNNFCSCILCSSDISKNLRHQCQSTSKFINLPHQLIFYLHSSTPTIWMSDCTFLQDSPHWSWSKLNVMFRPRSRRRWEIHRTNLTAKQWWKVKAQHVTEPWVQNFQMCLISTVRGEGLCSWVCCAMTCYNLTMWEGVCCVMFFSCVAYWWWYWSVFLLTGNVQ